MLSWQQAVYLQQIYSFIFLPNFQLKNKSRNQTARKQRKDRNTKFKTKNEINKYNKKNQHNTVSVQFLKTDTLCHLENDKRVYWQQKRV